MKPVKQAEGPHTHTWSDYYEYGIAECLLCPEYRMEARPVSVMEAIRRQVEKRD